ncbi:putative Zn(2)-C6 fungal-type domain-containing protein [Seiridium unicorne]|uniref:Zn(2)-C6 fungal-type domain-containing protein n=1 Tax=Seiridium unicorne TaxID=138068 RepID=A0ABR2V9F7_9PEZI
MPFRATNVERSGVECHFPGSRQRPTNVAKRPRVKDLEARLMSLEGQFKCEQPNAPVAPSPQPPEARLAETGRIETLPPQSVVDELTSLYFTRLYTEAPMQHPERYLASLHLPPHMQPPMCLQYVVLALAASLSHVHGPLALPYYHRARNYIQLDEMKNDGQDIMSVAHAQCWVLLANFEAQHLWFSRASLSVSRAVRLVQMLGLHDMETMNANGPTLPPPGDCYEREERRRTLWTVFCSDRLASSTTGWPALMDAGRIKTLLPVSEEKFRHGLEEQSVTLHQALRDNSTKYSHFACRVLAAQLFHECLDHIFGYSPSEDMENHDQSDFWRRHRRLDNRLAVMFMALPDNLRCPEHVDNHDAVFLSLKLHTASICIHRAEEAEAKKGVSVPPLGSTAAARSIAAAHEIFTIVARIGDVDAFFLNPFVAFAAFMAAMVYLEDYAASQDKQSEGRLGHLMDFMIFISKRNPITASLTVQLAQEMQRTEIDRTAMDKVSDLISNMDLDMPLMGQHKRGTGEILFCPLKSK